MVITAIEFPTLGDTDTGIWVPSGATENIALVAHAIKGASANVSAKRAAELAAALERVAKEDSSADLDLPLDELRTEIEAVLAETRAALGSLPQDAQTMTGGAS